MAHPDHPHIVPAPLWNGHVYHLSFQATPGKHTVQPVTDSANQNAEMHASNNTATALVVC